MEELLNILDKCSTIHTELITVYIPAGFSINQVINQLEHERGTASNIKSNSTRKNVILAIEKLIRILKSYRKTPKNGLALFCGNISTKNSGYELRSWVIEPAKKLNRRLYRCDKTFVLDPLYELIIDYDYYLLVVIENGDCSIGTYCNGYVNMTKRIKALIPSDNKKGGQSSQRFERIRMELKKGFRKKIALFINERYLFDKKLKGIIIGGTFVTVDEFKKSKVINTQLKKKIICTKSIDMNGLTGLKELSHKAMDDIASSEIIKKENIIESFFKLLSTNPERVSYGDKDVNELILSNRVSHIITTDASHKFINKTIINESIKRYDEIVGLGGTIAFLYY